MTLAQDLLQHICAPEDELTVGIVLIHAPEGPLLPVFSEPSLSCSSPPLTFAATKFPLATDSATSCHR